MSCSPILLITQCLTCRYDQTATATTAEVLQSYSISATNSDGIPGPQPLYKEAHDIDSPESTTDVTAVDFQLLRLSAGDLPGADLHQGLAELLRPSGKLCSHRAVMCKLMCKLY